MTPVQIEQKIYELRGQKVMLDADLALLYEVETKRLKEQVNRNMERFPLDFMFELTTEEFETLRSQIATSKRGGTRYKPYAFTEMGVAMLSSVLSSAKAIEVNISIMRAFTFLRQYALTHADLTQKLQVLEQQYDKKFEDIYQVIEYLVEKDKDHLSHQERVKIGYK